MNQLLQLMAEAPTGPFEPVFQSTSLSASDAATGRNFGQVVACNEDGTTVAVSAPTDSAIASNAGSVYVFVRSATGGWSQQAKLTSSTASQKLGTALALSDDGNTLVAGTNDGSHVLVYTRTGTSWGSPVTITPSTTGGSWGVSVGISADGARIVVGAPGQTYGGHSGAGVIYVYDLVSGSWTETLTALGRSGAAASEGVGTTVAISGDGNTIIATPSAAGTQRGTVFVLSGTWAQQAVLTDVLSTTANACAISTDGNTIAIAAGGAGQYTGAVYLRNGVSWALVSNLLLTSGFQGIVPTNWYSTKLSISGDGSLLMVLYYYFITTAYGVAALLFRNVGNHAYSALGTTSTPYLPDYKNGFLNGGYTGDGVYGIYSVALSRDGKSAFAGVPRSTGYCMTAQSGDRV